jgi:hypothetical protein
MMPLPSDLPAATGRPDADMDPALGVETLPFVSVIIPVFNGNSRLQVCLEALAGQTSCTPGRKRNTLWVRRLWALRSVRPPLRRLRRALMLPGIDAWHHRAALCAILMALPIVYAIEWMRMEAGLGRAERR